MDREALVSIKGSATVPQSTLCVMELPSMRHAQRKTNQLVEVDEIRNHMTRLVEFSRFITLACDLSCHRPVGFLEGTMLVPRTSMKMKLSYLMALLEDQIRKDRFHLCFQMRRHA